MPWDDEAKFFLSVIKVLIYAEVIPDYLLIWLGLERWILI